MNNRHLEIVSIIGPKNLQWSEDEQKYLLLSYLEVEEIVDKCVNAGIKKTDDIMVVIREYENMIAAQIAFRGFLNGDIAARVVDNEILWSSIE